jgi:hypothetical protein
MSSNPASGAEIARAAAGPALLALLSLLAISLDAPAAGAETEPEAVLGRPLHRPPFLGSAAAPFGTANSNCAGSECDTVWVGHSNAGPGGAFLGVGVGGVWDFDTGIAGTDSSQGFRQWRVSLHAGATLPVLQRTWWCFDFGNQVNAGNTNLWAARDLAGRKYVKTGVAGAWHADDMVGVKLNIANGAEPSATPIAGARSAWCGLRESGNTRAQDALTGNYINGDLVVRIGAGGTLPEFPGYCDQWDQMMYKDFPSTGTGTVAFRFRTDMSPFVDTIQNGTGWFNPDPTSIAHYVNNPADSFMVYVGAPNEVAYDTNRRWFSEVLDLTRPWQEILAVGGAKPVVGADSAVTRPYSGIVPVGGVVRVVFRVKTNRVRADQSTGFASGYNSKQGAALVDEVSVDGGPVHGFETAADVRGRSLIPDLAAPLGPWATTGKPAEEWFQIRDVAGLIYEDLCGVVGSPVRTCNLRGNVLLLGDPAEGPILSTEGRVFIESPTVDLAVRTAAPGTKNAQGIDQETASRQKGVFEYDLYSGYMNLDQSVFYNAGARSYAPSVWKQPVSGHPTWSDWYGFSTIFFNPDPLCFRDLWPMPGAYPEGLADSVRIGVEVLTQFYRFGGDDLGNTRGTYFDNFRIGFVRTTPPVLTQHVAHHLQDQFPVNQGIVPGDNAAFDTTTAHMTTGMNIAAVFADAVVAGDSMVVQAPFGSGNGTSSGVRMDLVFRIDPGPGNHVVKGNRASALVDFDPLHPFFATYLANNGPHGTPGGHGGTWNRHVWNSARMDSAERRLYPILARGISGPVADHWMGTLHEQDPNYATLGIDRPLCFLVDPNGPDDESNTSCLGSPPAPYGGVAASSREATKILPDGWFTPGTHVEYFVRRSTLEDPATAILLFDTTRVVPQDAGAHLNLDQERWSSVDVLPDMWKSSRYGGRGLACLLMIDGADRRGSDPSYRGAADTLGFGANDGATSGWVGLGPGSDPNDPDGFVAANEGQYGLHYDHYDLRGAESAEAGHPGVRLATNPGPYAARADRSGPSPAMLAAFYRGVLHFTGDLLSSTLSDGFDSQEPADDIALYTGFLAGATPASRRSLWLSGNGLVEDAFQNSDDGSVLAPFYTNWIGATLVSTDYHVYSGSATSTVGFLPVAPWAHPGRVYGLSHLCTQKPDVLAVAAATAGAAEAARYEALGNPDTTFTASVYRPAAEGRNYRTLVDGFDLSLLRGHYANLGQIATLPGTNLGRMLWFDDAWVSHLQLCARQGWIGIGDLPGPDGGGFANRLLGSAPNPAFAGQPLRIRFTLARAREVTVRIHDAAGREVAVLRHRGVEGPNDVPWDGRRASGARAAAGVYFYRLEGVELDDARAKRKIVLLGAR